MLRGSRRINRKEPKGRKEIRNHRYNFVLYAYFAVEPPKSLTHVIKLGTVVPEYFPLVLVADL